MKVFTMGFGVFFSDDDLIPWEGCDIEVKACN